MARFAVVGVGGFVVDGGILQALVSGIGMDPLAARLISFPLAVLFTWWLNRSFTFGVQGGGRRDALTSMARYLLVSIGGTAVNFVTYTLLILGVESLRPLPILPLAVASVVAMAFNYLGTRYFAFRQPEDR